MTTQTQETKIKQAHSSLLMKKTHIWPLVLAAFIILSIIGGAIVVSQPREEEFVRNRRALESITARYQVMADLYPAKEKTETQRVREEEYVRNRRALESITARYQVMADLYPAREKAETQRAREEEFVRNRRVLESITARYQVMAEITMRR